MSGRLTALLLCLCLAASGSLAVAGCGGDSGGGGTSSKKKKAKKKAKKAGAASDTAAVSMMNTAFEPQSVTVKQGGAVTWTNHDSVGHDVTAEDRSFRSGKPGSVKQDATFEHTFDQTGTFAYVCTVHPNMTGTVEVVPK